MGRLTTGKHPAIARSWDFGLTKKDLPQVAVEFEIVDGEDAGEFITWYGYFTDDTEPRPLESLRACGWQGDDVSDLKGMGSRKVSLVVEDELYEGKTHSRVRWVNRFGGNGVRLAKTMDAQARRQLAARLRSAAAATPVLPPDDAPAQPGRSLAARPEPPPAAPRGQGFYQPPAARGPSDQVGLERFSSYEPPPHGDDDIPF